MSRQAVAKHLASLEAAGLVHGTRVGRNTRPPLTRPALGGNGLDRPRRGGMGSALAALAAHVSREDDRNTP